MINFFRKPTRQEKFINKCREKLKQNGLPPKYVQWIATHECNFNCSHCGTDAGEKLGNELSTQEIKNVISGLGKMNTTTFSITGGEPLLREDIFEIIDYVVSWGIKVGIVSNGYLTSDLIKKIESTNLDGVLISIDGYGKRHNKIRGKKSYDKCLESLRIYDELGVNVVGVSTVVMEENINDLPKIIEDIWENGCNKQRLQPVVPEGRAKDRIVPSWVIKKAFKLVAEYRKRGLDIHLSEGFGYLGPLENKVRKSTFFCGCGWGTFTIMADGLVMGCPAVEFKELSEGNIREESIREIWQNKFKRFRKKYHSSVPQKCKSCKYLRECRGGCWLLQLNGDPCFLEEAEEVAEELS